MLASPSWHVTADWLHPSSSRSADILVADYETAMQLLCASTKSGQAQDILIVTTRDKPVDIRRALDSQVKGYVLEDTTAAELQLAVHTIINKARYFSPAVVNRICKSEPWVQLTKRERDVLGLMAQGLCNKSIARLLGIEVGTVKTHVGSIMTKMGAKARTHAVIMAAQLGLVAIDVSGHAASTNGFGAGTGSG